MPSHLSGGYGDTVELTFDFPGDLPPPDVRPTPPEAFTAGKDDDVRLCALAIASREEASVQHWQRFAEEKALLELRKEMVTEQFREIDRRVARGEMSAERAANHKLAMFELYRQAVMAIYKQVVLIRIENRLAAYGERGIAARPTAGPDFPPSPMPRWQIDIPEGERNFCNAYVGTRLDV